MQGMDGGSIPGRGTETTHVLTTEPVQSGTHVPQLESLSVATKSCVLQLRHVEAKFKKKIKTIHHASERYGNASLTMVHRCRDLTDCLFTCRVPRGLWLCSSQCCVNRSLVAM